MKLPRRQFLHLAAGAAALPAVSRIARAQAYPSRPVHIIVGFPGGSASDTTARFVSGYRSAWASHLSSRTGRARPATLLRRRWCVRLPMATRCSSSLRSTR